MLPLSGFLGRCGWEASRCVHVLSFCYSTWPNASQGMRFRHTFQISAFWNGVVWLSWIPDLGCWDSNLWVHSGLQKLLVFAQVNHASVVTWWHFIVWTSLYLTLLTHKGRLNLVSWMDPQKVLLDLVFGPMIAPEASGFQKGWLDMDNPLFGKSFVAHPSFL